MNKLIILRGAPGSGKSTFVKKNHLKDITLSSDDLRLKIAGVTRDKNGNKMISQAKNKEVFAELRRQMIERMEKGEDVLVDATHYRASDVHYYNEFCNKYGYKKYLVEFRVPLKTCLERNKQRKAYKRVPESIIKKFHYYIESEPIKSPSWTIFMPEDAVRFLQNTSEAN